MKHFARILCSVGAVSALACIGDWSDNFYPPSQSNCVVTSYADFASQGFDLYHSWPKRCPIDIVESSPWIAATLGFTGVITAPSSSVADIVAHTFNNADGAPVAYATTFMHSDGVRLRGDINTYYPAGTVEPALGQYKTDYAWSVPHGISGSARVSLPYTKTRALAQGPDYAQENEVFQLSVYPVGSLMAEPVTYQWFRGDVPYGDPTTSNYLAASISGSGFTIPFRVDATDANGVVVSNKVWVTVPANCPNPPCAAQ